MKALWLLAIIALVEFAAVVFGAASHGSNAHYPFLNVSLPWDVRVDDIVKRLTLEEMQLQMGRGGAGSRGGPAPAISRLGIGPYEWDTECLRGDESTGVTSFPQALGLAAAFSTDLIFRVAQAAGVEVRGKHNDFVKQNNFHMHTGASCFSPVINIMRDSRWGRNQETYGEDPFLSGAYATAYIKGLQGNHHRYVRASGGCKHFDVHGGPENHRMKFNAIVAEEDWRMTFLPAFRTCVEAGTYNLMCSYNRINGVPACANKKLLTDVARGEWGFKGYIISDQGAIEHIIDAHHYLNNSVDTVAACVNAGCNLELSNDLKNPVYFSLVDAVKQGKVKEETVRERVRPLFYTRMRLGEFDPPDMDPYSKLSGADVLTPEHKALSLEAAMKTFVLLKNNGILPLKHTPLGAIGVVGPFANTTQIVGDYAPKPPPELKTTALQGLSKLAHHVKVAEGCDAVNEKCSHYDSQSVIKAVSGNDVNFVLLGLGLKAEREGIDLPNSELPGNQKNLLQDVLAHTHNTPVVVLLFNACPVNISFADKDPRVAAILECFYPAMTAGDAIRHVLLNDAKGAVPAGRLPYTWPMLASQLPPITNYTMKGRTYRYFEGDPLYPFGYGLSYTTFEYNYLIHLTSIHAGQSLTGSITVRNTGKLDADEVVQIYIRWKDTSLPAPKMQLAWFKRVTLAAGHEVTLSFTIDAKLMALWINDGWYIKPGTMDIFGGGQQPFQKRKAPSNVVSSSFTMTGTKSLGKY